MEITQRQVVLGMLGLQIACGLLLLLGQFMIGGDTLLLFEIGAGVLISGVLLMAYQRGWEAARHANVVIMTLLIGVSTPPLYVVGQPAPIALVPPALALILAGPSWILGSAITLLIIFLIRGGGVTSYTEDLRTFASMIVIIGSMFLSRLVADTARRAAERNARDAAAAQAHAEQQALELAEQAGTLIEQSTRQQRLLDLVATLETPAVALADGVLLAPIVGYLDSQRAAMLTERLLHLVFEQRAQLVLLDIAGVAETDNEVARALLQTTQALRLLGCQVTITGISPAVAIALTGTGASLEGVATARAPQDVLESFLGTRQPPA